MKHGILLAGGFLFLGCGAVGIVLPVWPTTPFVLLAISCFSCSPRLRARILRIGFFRAHYENYKSRQGLSARTVTISLAYLWGMLLLSMVLVRRLWLTALLSCIGAAVTAHLLYMARPKPPQEG